MGSSPVEMAIVKPISDKRDYRRIVLPNSLQVLVISDPDTDKAAASMNVSVGHFADPEGLEGLAHFLEHMLFFASEKYPVEDSYSKYITEHGGSTNAFTAHDHTNFYFDVNADCLEDALDRFAQFFIKPLMSSDAVLREINAVDSENKKNLQSDSWRLTQLKQHLSSKDHPYHKFGTGNWDTLEVKPKEKGLDVRIELIKFYEENYSSNLMHLVVYGRENLDNIQEIVYKRFKDIRDIAQNPINFPGKPCQSEHLQILVKAVPVMQNHTLTVIWPITPNIQHYKEAPLCYISHLVGHEGEGSLFALLKQLGWAISLCAYEEDLTFDSSFFTVSIVLTNAGHDHVEDIVGLLFIYVRLLQNSGIPEWIFDELRVVSESNFNYQDKVAPSSYVVKVSSNMRKFRPEEWLTASSVPSTFSKSTIQKILDELTPDTVRIFWSSKKFEGQTNCTEPWYGTEYSVENVSPDTILKWMERYPTEDLHLPKPNIFIPTDFSLKNVSEKAKFPVLLRKTSFSRLWYKADTMFSVPKAFTKIDFNCPLSNQSPASTVLTAMFTRLLMDYLNEYAYDADMAGLYYTIGTTDAGFQVTVSGYNHKMRILLETIVHAIAEFKVKTDRFAVVKEALLKDYENFKYQQPYSQAFYYCSIILEDLTFTWDEEFEALKLIEADDLAKFSPLLLSKAFLECYIAGNIEASEAQLIIQHIEDALFIAHPICAPLSPSQHWAKRIVKLEKGSRFFYLAQGLNQKDENSALIHYVQVHQDETKLNVRLELLARIAQQPTFHQLRTVEQLGYITALVKSNYSGVQGLQFIIQSYVKDPSYVETRVSEFLATFEGTLKDMPDEELKENITALINMKLEKHKNMWEESSFFWKEISVGTLKFDRIDLEVAALRELKKEELVDFFVKYIKLDSPLRKTLSIQVYGSLHGAEYQKIEEVADSPGSYKISDIYSFKRSRPLYGSFRGGLRQTKL